MHNYYSNEFAGRQCGTLITSSKFSSGGFPAAYTGNTPRTCTYLVANLQTFSHTDLRFLFTDLKNCTQGMIEVYTHVGNVATICNAEDAQNALSVPDFLFTKYTHMCGNVATNQVSACAWNFQYRLLEILQRRT